MLKLQCGSCGKSGEMTNEQVIELAKTPTNIPKCPEDGSVMWPIGADKPSDKMKKVCIDTAKILRPENLN